MYWKRSKAPVCSKGSKASARLVEIELRQGLADITRNAVTNTFLTGLASSVRYLSGHPWSWSDFVGFGSDFAHRIGLICNL